MPQPPIKSTINVIKDTANTASATVPAFVLQNDINPAFTSVFPKTLFEKAFIRNLFARHINICSASNPHQKARDNKTVKSCFELSETSIIHSNIGTVETSEKIIDKITYIENFFSIFIV